MRQLRKDPDQWWRLPSLTSDGQKRFWDRQTDYESAEMTNDNAGELDIVTRLSDEFVAWGHAARDVVTFGGADGCRDPGVVVKRLVALGRAPREIFFNDLSDRLAEKASKKALAPYEKAGIRVLTRPGKTIDIAKEVSKVPRRVLIGAYKAEAFISAAPKEEKRRCGFNEYLGNGSILGDSFFMEWFCIESGMYVSQPGTRFIAGRLAEEDSPTVLRQLTPACSEGVAPDAGALRVVGVHEDHPHDFFLSHWFTQRGFESLLRQALGDRARSMRMFPCAKGMVACIDPVGAKPQGILTVLNNVIGNVLPDEQVPSLRAIHEVTA